jgi:hypothetical protein
MVAGGVDWFGRVGRYVMLTIISGVFTCYGDIQIDATEERDRKLRWGWMHDKIPGWQCFWS